MGVRIDFLDNDTRRRLFTVYEVEVPDVPAVEMPRAKLAQTTNPSESHKWKSLESLHSILLPPPHLKS